tara:strand:+ start:1207 stop:1764 length:558 start_codon:yes stop_codon:yes gene_type:complete
MIAHCIFYGNKYPYSNVVNLQREFKNHGVKLKCEYIKDFTSIKKHWHKLKYFNDTNEDTIIVDIDQTVVGDISDMINYPVRDNELVTYKNWWDHSPKCPINGGWYKFKSGSLQYVWDKFNLDIEKWQLHYYNNGTVHYQYYGEQNFVYDTVIENGGRITTMPEKWYSKNDINEDTKIVHHLGVDK